MSKFLTGFKALMCVSAAFLCGGASAVSVSTPKLLVNFKFSNGTDVSGWNNWTQTSGGCLGGESGITDTASGVKFVTSSVGSFSPQTASTTDYSEGAYTDIFGESHTSLMDEVKTSLGLTADITSDVYGTGLQSGGRNGNVATISGLDPNKSYVVYMGYGLHRADNNYYHGFNIATTGYTSVEKFEYVVTVGGQNTTAATTYTEFNAGTEVRHGNNGLMLIRAKNIVPKDNGEIVFTLAGSHSGMNFLAVAEVADVELNPMYYNQLAGSARVPAGSYGAITIDESTGGYKAITYSANTGLSGTGVGSFANVGSIKDTRKMIDTHTIAGWFKVDALPTGDATKDVFVMRTGTDNYNGYKVVIDANGVLKIGRTNYDGGNYSWNDNKRVSLTGASGAVASGTWFHLAIAFTYDSNGSYWHLTPVAWINGVAASKSGDDYIDINLNGPGYVDDIRMGAGISAAGLYIDSSAHSSAKVIKAIATDSTYVCAVKRPGFADWSNLDSTARCGTHFGKSGADLTFKLNPTTECPLGTTVAISTIKIANGEKTMANTITINGAVGTKQSATEPFTPLGTVGAGPIDRLYVYQFATPAIVAVGHEYPVEMTSSQLSAINDANSPILISGLSGEWTGYNGYCAIETQIKNSPLFSYDGDPSSDWQSTGLEVAQDQATAFLESLTTDYAFAMTFGDTNMDRVPRNGKAVNPVLHDDGVMTVEFQVVNGKSGGYKKMAFVGFKVDGGYLKVKRLTSAFAASSFSGSMVTYLNGTITMANDVTESSNAYPLSKLSATPLVETVATIGEREFVSLAKALKTAENEATSENRLTVTLLKGFDGDLSVPEWVTVDAGSYEISGKIVIAANAQVTIAGTQTTHGVSGSGKLVKNGTGEVKGGRDSSNNTISGVTVEVNGGTLWLGHSSVTTGATVQNCAFVLNGGTLNAYGWPSVNNVTFECRQNATLFSGTNDGFSIENGSFTKTGSGALTVNAHLKGSLTISIEGGGAFTVPSGRSIANSVTFTQATLGSDDTWTAPNAVVISGAVSGSGTFNADLTFNAGSTINATNGTVSLADGKSLTFPEGELNLVGVENGGTIISNVTSIPNGLSTVVVKIGGEAVGHLEYDAENHTVIYSTNTVTEVTPNITDPANLDSNGNFLWTSGAIWNTEDGTLPEGARIVFDAAEIAGVVISGQTEAGEIIVKNSDSENHPFVFHNHTKEVDGTHEIDDEIDCLTATSINVEGLNGELGLRVPIKGDIRFGTQTTLKFIASSDKDHHSRAYDYSIVGRPAAIQVALDTDAEAGWFVVPVSMYGNAFAPAAGVTAIYASTGTVTGGISGAGKIAIQTETVTISSTINCDGGLSVESGKAIIPVLNVNDLYAKPLTVEQDAELEINEGDWLSYSGTYAFTVSGTITVNARQSVSANCTLTLNDGAVINGAASDSQGDWEYHAGAGEGKLVVADGATAKINRLGIRGSNTVTVSGSGSTLKLPEGVFGSGKITLTDGVTVNVAAGKTASFTDAPSNKILKSTVESDGSTSYRLVDVVAQIIDGETTTNFASVEEAFEAATAEQVVTLCANIPGDLMVPENKKADAGSYTIGGAIAIGANATLTVSGNRETKGIAGPGTFIVTSGTITAKNKSDGYAVDGATVQIDGNSTFTVSLGNNGAFADARGDGSVKDAKFVIGENATLRNEGFVNLVGTISFETDATKGVFRSDKGFRGTPAIVKSGSGTLTFLAFKQNDNYKFTSLTLNGGELKLESAVVVDELISGVEGKRVSYDEATKTYSLVDAVTPIKPGTETDPQPTKPTEEELAQYEPTPVNSDAAEAGQASILKVVSKETAEGWVITVDLDETKMPEGKKVDDTALAFASEGLAEIAGSTEGQEISIPATAVTPGAYYSIIYGDTPTALSSEGDRSLATSEGVTITVPAMSGKKVQFFRVKASAYPTAN